MAETPKKGEVWRDQWHNVWLLLEDPPANGGWMKAVDLPAQTINPEWLTEKAELPFLLAPSGSGSATPPST